MAIQAVVKPWIKPVAQAGLIAKGAVYVLLGVLAFMAAFEIGGKGSAEASQTGALQSVREWPAGNVLLLALAAGLLCYAIWRGIQTFVDTGVEKKGWKKRLRYGLSGATYAVLAYSSLRLSLGPSQKKGDKNQAVAAELLDKPFGQVLVGLAALTLAAVGVYQIYYGLSEKYKKHVKGLSLKSEYTSLLLRSGKIGYVSRGAVWLLMAALFGRAAIYAAASEAGDTSKTLQFIEDSPYGSYLLGALGLGLAAYGVFNFIRARYDHFG
jgi:hypothetical protein